MLISHNAFPFRTLISRPGCDTAPIDRGREEVHPTIDSSRFSGGVGGVQMETIREGDWGMDAEECELELFPRLLEQQ